MNDDRTREPDDADPLDDARVAVVAADDTGMISNEIRIVEAELEDAPASPPV